MCARLVFLAACFWLLCLVFACQSKRMWERNVQIQDGQVDRLRMEGMESLKSLGLSEHRQLDLWNGRLYLRSYQPVRFPDSLPRLAAELWLDAGGEKRALSADRLEFSRLDSLELNARRDRDWRLEDVGRARVQSDTRWLQGLDWFWLSLGLLCFALALFVLTRFVLRRF